MRPRIFVGSSVEQLELAYAVQEGLEHDGEVTVWSQGVFQLSRTSMASLVDQLDETDFAVFVLSPDDVSAIRGKNSTTVRDNVIFELGLFAGRLGPSRCYMIVPRGVEDLHLPTDLLGLTPGMFDPDRQDKNLVAALGPACNRIRKSIIQLGSFERTTAPNAPIASPTDTELTDDPDDCIALIQSWMGRRPTSDNLAVMRYADVDRELKLAPGSARLYIKQAASRWNYVAEREGKDTVLFKDSDRATPYY